MAALRHREPTALGVTLDPAARRAQLALRIVRNAARGWTADEMDRLVRNFVAVDIVCQLAAAEASGDLLATWRLELEVREWGRARRAS